MKLLSRYFTLSEVYIPHLPKMDWFTSLKKNDHLLIEHYLKTGGNPNHVIESGHNLLTMACCLNAKETVELLLEFGAEIDYQDFHGNTALIGAAFHGNDSIVTLLLQNGANPFIKNNINEDALYYSTILGHESVQNLLEIQSNLFSA